MTQRAKPASRCVVLMATKDRWSLLTERSLPSVRRQTTSPEALILVNDGLPFSPEQQSQLGARVAPVPLTILANANHPGAAGAWNTGLQHLWRSGYDGYVAILDDDDGWDDEHLACNLAAAKTARADVVVSGLRRDAGGEVRPRALPADLTARDFLRGNPGWQGSNTFASIAALERAGKFTEGLLSLNDRDLAIRLLSLTGVRVVYTGRWSATWHHREDDPHALSAPRSAAKISGLRMFWRLHREKMAAEDAAAYFDRAWRFFGVTREEIVE